MSSEDDQSKQHSVHTCNHIKLSTAPKCKCKAKKTIIYEMRSSIWSSSKPTTSSITQKKWVCWSPNTNWNFTFFYCADEKARRGDKSFIACVCSGSRIYKIHHYLTSHQLFLTFLIASWTHPYFIHSISNKKNCGFSLYCTETAHQHAFCTTIMSIPNM